MISFDETTSGTSHTRCPHCGHVLTGDAGNVVLVVRSDDYVVTGEDYISELKRLIDLDIPEEPLEPAPVVLPGPSRVGEHAVFIPRQINRRSMVSRSGFIGSVGRRKRTGK